MDSDLCHRCEQTYCCDSYASCNDNSDCHAFLDCWGTCNGSSNTADMQAGGLPTGGALACDQYCSQSYPNGLIDLAPLMACVDQYCLAACGATVTPCEACTNTNCANERANADGTPDGWLVGDCIYDCNGNVGCFVACEDAYPDVKAAEDTFNTCEVAKCMACLQ
jgi:hypothetical protein